MSDKPKTPQRPLPTLKEPDTRAFWQATKNKQLTYQQCNACGSNDLAVKTSAGKGRVYSYSVVRQAYHPFFRQKVPYAVAWIDLDEGPRLISNVVGVKDPTTDIQCDMAVEVEWEEHEELSVPLFRLV